MWMHDLRFALRGLRRHPGFALAAVVAAALGIGPATAVFSVVDRVLWRPLPYSGADRLVSTGMMAPLDTSEFVFAPSLVALRRAPGPFAAVTAFQAGAIECDLQAGQHPARLRAMRVPAGFLQALGARLHAGREFTPEEDQRSAAPVAMLSYSLWRTRLPGALHKTITIDGQPVYVTGVLAPDFEMPTLTQMDLLLPMALDEGRERGAGRAFRAFARLKPGVSAGQAQQQLRPFIAEQMLTVPPRFRQEVTWVTRSLRERQSGPARLASYSLAGAALAVLLIACANVANLLLARAVGREREFAIRRALGASRWRLAGQVLTESLLLGALGGALGVALAAALLRWITLFGADTLPRIEQAHLDGRVLAAAVALSLLASLVFGLLPAWRTAPPASRRPCTWRPALVGAQVALTMVLLSLAGLLLKTLWTLEATRTGLDAGQVLTARFVLGQQRYGGANTPAQLAFFSQLEQRLAALPGVTASAITDSLPPSGGARGRPFSTLEVEGRAPLAQGTGGMVLWRYITPGYFAALRIPMVRGRNFDATSGEAPIVLSETLARRLFGKENPLGRHVLRTPEGGWHTVTGVAEDVRNAGLQKQPDPEFYLLRRPVADGTFRNAEPPLGWRSAAAVVRTPLSPAVAAPALREAIQSLDATLPVEVVTMQERLDGVTARPRFQAWLLAAFAATGLALAAIGLFGVLVFLAAQRRREMGIRMALGATPGDIRALVLRQAAAWVVAGATAGVWGALLVAQSMQALLTGVAPSDPAVLAVAFVILLATGLLAAWAPARSAARTDPALSLRHD